MSSMHLVTLTQQNNIKVRPHSSALAVMDRKINATMNVRHTDWDSWQNTAITNFHPSCIYINNKL